MDNRDNNGEKPNHMEYEDETFETWEKFDKDGIDQQYYNQDGVQYEGSLPTLRYVIRVIDGSE